VNICNIETDISDHCNLKCANCSHHSPYVTKGFYEIEQFKNDIDKASDYLSCNWFKLLGGEPLLNTHIFDYVNHLHVSEICKNIAIFTNGILLNKVSAELLTSVDCVVVSRYPGNETYTKLVKDNIEYAREHTRVIHNYYDKFEAQEFTNKNTDQDLIKKIFDRCKLRYECNAIYKGYFYKCMACQRKKDFLRANNLDSKDVTDPGVDGVKIDSPNFHEKLIKYYYSDTPLNACAYCTGSSGKDVPHVNKLTKPAEKIQEVVDMNKLNTPAIHETDDIKYLMTPITGKRRNIVRKFKDNDGLEHDIVL